MLRAHLLNLGWFSLWTSEFIEEPEGQNVNQNSDFVCLCFLVLLSFLKVATFVLHGPLRNYYT